MCYFKGLPSTGLVLEGPSPHANLTVACPLGDHGSPGASALRLGHRRRHGIFPLGVLLLQVLVRAAHHKIPFPPGVLVDMQNSPPGVLVDM